MNRKTYDPNIDYQEKINESDQKGDFLTAGQLEQIRNAKIQGENLSWGQSQKYQPYMQAVADRERYAKELENRKPVTYDADDDPLYRMYQQQYMSQGKTAMEDTIGKGAAMTGGYGNSYGQIAGQQAYNEYAGKAAGMIPELYQLAYSRYQDEGSRMESALERALTAEQLEYNRLSGQRDFQYQRDQNERSWEYQKEQDAYQREQNERSWEYQKEQDAQSRQDSEKEKTYNMAISLLSGGQMPNSDMLSEAGIDEETARMLYRIATGKDYDSNGEEEIGASGNYTGTSGNTGTYGNEKPKNLQTMAAEYFVQNPNVKLDSRTLDNWLSANGISGKDAQEFKAYLQYAGAGYSRGR